MKNERELIPQTNRTMLFAKINGEKDDLLTLLADGAYDDEKVKNINQKLVVSSFDEFLEKFEPSVYSVITKKADRTPSIQYSLENIGEQHTLKKGNEALEMLCQLLDSKKGLGESNVNFDYQKLLELITPENTIKKMKQIRKETIYLNEEFHKLPDGSPKKNELGAALNAKFKSIRENYKNIPAVLALRVGDIQNAHKQLKQFSVGNSEPISAERLQLTFSDKGDLQVKELPVLQTTENNAPKQISHNVKLVETIGTDYEKQSQKQNFTPVPFVKEMFMTQFSTDSNALVLTEQVMAQHDLLIGVLSEEKKNYFDAITPLLQTILGVKLFFDQYQENHKGSEDKPELLITNCAAADFADNDGKDKLGNFLKEINTKTDLEKAIWFAIIPAVSEPISSSTSADDDENKPFPEGDNSPKTSGNENCDLGNLIVLAEVLKEYRVLTFFNFAPKRENGFSKIGSQEISALAKITESLQKDPKKAEYLVHCLPNFTVIPKGKSYDIGSRMINDGENDENKVENKKEIVELPGIYIDSAFIACGLSAAWQSPAFLTKRFSKKEVANYHGVRFDIEKANNALHLYTSLPKEIAGFNENFRGDLNKIQYGFFFSSDKYVAKDEIPQNRITVLKARTLGKNKDFSKDGYKQLFKIMNETYILRLIKMSCNGKITRSGIIEIIGDTDSSYKQNWRQSLTCVNGIMQVDDTLVYNETEKRIDISYKGSEESIDLVINAE